MNMCLSQNVELFQFRQFSDALLLTATDQDHYASKKGKACAHHGSRFSELAWITLQWTQNSQLMHFMESWQQAKHSGENIQNFPHYGWVRPLWCTRRAPHCSAHRASWPGGIYPAAAPVAFTVSVQQPFVSRLNVPAVLREKDTSRFLRRCYGWQHGSSFASLWHLQETFLPPSPWTTHKGRNKSWEKQNAQERET